MSKPIPGEYNPPNLRLALMVCRLANAEWNQGGRRGMPYVVKTHIHEALDPNCEVPIWDDLDAEWLTPGDLLLRLSPENARLVRWTFSLKDGQGLL